MRTKTFTVKKSTVFIFLFMFILAVTGFMLLRTYNVMQEGVPEPLTDYENIELIQLTEPPEGAKTAVISTSAGDITVTLFENETPQAVEIFSAAAAAGDYSGLTARLYELHTIFTLDTPPLPRVYTPELHKNLWPFKGAVCMNSQGDIIFINTIEYTDEDRAYLASEDEGLPEVRAAFLEKGGVPNYSGQLAVFGQVTEGLEVLEDIALSDMERVVTVNSVEIS